MQSLTRNTSRFKIAAQHFACCLLIAAFIAIIFFGIWYPFPYDQMENGRELFFLIVIIDVICGPILTFILFDITKKRNELFLDIGLIILIQFGALGYGLHKIWVSRPLFLVMEIDRFKVVNQGDIDPIDIFKLPDSLRPQFWRGPVQVALLPFKNIKEKTDVMFESLSGGRDYGARPSYYVRNTDSESINRIASARPLDDFLKKYPNQRKIAVEQLLNFGIPMASAHYLPIVGRQNWIAILNARGVIVGYLKGDGF